MDTSYEESYLFVLWALHSLPFPRNQDLQIEVSSYGFPATLSSLTEIERKQWEAYRAEAIKHLGQRFISACRINR